MAPMDFWKNFTPCFGATDFCMTNYGDFGVQSQKDKPTACTLSAPYIAMLLENIYLDGLEVFYSCIAK